ncbi:SAM-dependent DNA methyltransferase [Subsaximicrobium wynnwilliamsii]|uniref:site-specific DNA-methyltransferase (adenine-specific) n=1 Tax=Subsaximicrobium wynnwilliamsii TaxID=291179 RepID=A0A5C6ZHK3_9FLAO|nr:class I SAM-dependent DNA methyltransferase [Subsaximicrobium wynnwilliamsii]TXD83867.1 SAM-dependent DNA methyltransferase [Subsaximicrobium wynnwilliamsii]TXD89608.1 SAM-dependent DNA methyltransferase [Subsaximicrobium wynnwilliamsii]TXE02601.1 SAM-dependent DNA methyltransferase [Subsaximicrobium wynnwilliamsii]
MSTNKLTLETLESWLWDSANILRGSIDSSDFKNYIFGLLFLKRSNDVFEEEVEQIMKRDKVSREIAEDDTYFQLPPESRWESIKKHTENIGIALDKAFAAMERENTSLEGVMTATKFGDKEKLSDELLQRLLRHFNQHSLRNDHLESNDLLGDAYEYLIKMFADDAGKKGGEFYTPRGVVQLIVQLIKPEPKQKVYDPTCGSGGMLIESARYIAEQPNGKVGNNINVSLFGQEKNLGTWAIGKLNMLLHNFMDADIRKGDTLINPQHKNDNNELTLFDRVIANPPFSQNGWWTPAENSIEVKLDKNGKEKKVSPNYNKVVSDPYGRFQFGIPPRGYADLAFLQHMIAVLKQDGKAGVVLPHGTLFRSGSEGKIRQGLLEADLVEGIVGLPSALFYNTGIPASIWIINKNKTEVQKGKVTIIDASSDYKEGKNQNELLEAHVAKIVNAYDDSTDVDKYMRIVDLKEIADNDYNLNISRFIDTSEPEVEVDIIAVHQKLEVLEQKEAEIDKKLAEFLKELGI